MRGKLSGVVTMRLSVALSLIACGGSDKRASPGVSGPDGVGCDQAAGYELSVDSNLDAANNWSSAADSTPGAVATVEAVAYDSSERCADSGTAEAIVFLASGNGDSGGAFVCSAIPGNPLRGTGWEGLAFWARTHGVTDAGVSFESDRAVTIEIAEQACAPPNTGAIIIDQTTGQPIGPPCTVSRQLTVTEDWRLYLVPWQSLQVVSVNASSGIAGPTVTSLDFRTPPGAHLELWVDDLGFYRARPAP